VELEHLKISTRLANEMFASGKGESEKNIGIPNPAPTPLH